MTVIADKDRDTVRDLLARELVHDIDLLFFTQGRTDTKAPEPDDCQTCDEMHELLAEIVSLSDKLRLTTRDVATDTTIATRFNVMAVPTVLLRRAGSSPALDSEDADLAPGIRFVGLPSGYEFTTLVADIVDISKGVTGLSPSTLEVVRAVDEPVHIQVFVTPSCPYCPRAARLAHQMAMENRLIVADVIEANEFPELSRRYEVRSVPKTVINNRVQFVGALPEARMVEALSKAISHE